MTEAVEVRRQMLPFRFGVYAAVAPTMSAWRDQARMAEDLGYSTLYVSDHLDAQFGPLVATTVAAEATSTLHVGSFVLNNDLRHPVVLAKEIATLGLAAEGRVEVGLGAGWLRSDYEQAGIEFDELAVRVDRLAESLTVMKRLWSEGKATFAGRYYTVRDAHCDPRPASPPRVMVGGGSKRMLTLAAREADTVGINTSLSVGRRQRWHRRARPPRSLRPLPDLGTRSGAGSVRFDRVPDRGLRHQNRRQPPRGRAHRNHARPSG